MKSDQACNIQTSRYSAPVRYIEDRYIEDRYIEDRYIEDDMIEDRYKEGDMIEYNAIILV